MVLSILVITLALIDEIPEGHRLIRVTKLEYYPCVVYTCPVCNIQNTVVVKQYLKRAHETNSNLIVSDNPELAYRPVNIRTPYCPQCGMQMRYDMKSDFPVICLYGRDMITKKKVRYIINDIEPEFWIRKSDYHIIEEELAPIITCRIKRIEDNGYYDYNGVPLLKIVTYLPKDIHSSSPGRRGDSESVGIPSLRDKFPLHYQADILFEVKAYTDMKLKQFVFVPNDRKLISKHDVIPVTDINITEAPPLRYVIYDIETKHSAGIDLAKQGNAHIYSITLYDNYTNKFHILYNYDIPPNDITKLLSSIKSKVYEYVHQVYCPRCNDFYDSSVRECVHCMIDTTSLYEINPAFSHFILNANINLVYTPTERDMLLTFVKIIKKLNPDVMGGHNSSNFDDVVIYSRIRKILRGNIPLHISHRGFSGILPFDFMDAWLSTQRSKDVPHKLDDVAKRELGATKYTYNNDIDFLYKHDIVTLLTYNFIDVALTVGYNEKIR